MTLHHEFKLVPASLQVAHLFNSTTSHRPHQLVFSLSSIKQWQYLSTTTKQQQIYYYLNLTHRFSFLVISLHNFQCPLCALMLLVRKEKVHPAFKTPPPTIPKSLLLEDGPNLKMIKVLWKSMMAKQISKAPEGSAAILVNFMLLSFSLKHYIRAYFISFYLFYFTLQLCVVCLCFLCMDPHGVIYILENEWMNTITCCKLSWLCVSFWAHVSFHIAS